MIWFGPGACNKYPVVADSKCRDRSLSPLPLPSASLGARIAAQAAAKPFSLTSTVSLMGGAQEEAEIQLQQRTATLQQETL